jgi:hypothetical protein
VGRLRRGQLRCFAFAFAFVGASLLAKAACQPTNFFLMYINPVGASLLAKAPCQPTCFSLNTHDQNCRSEPARDCALLADHFLPDVHQSCGSWLASEGGLPADLFLADVLDSNCRSEPAREGALPADLFLTEHPRSKL